MRKFSPQEIDCKYSLIKMLLAQPENIKMLLMQLRELSLIYQKNLKINLKDNIIL